MPLKIDFYSKAKQRIYFHFVIRGRSGDIRMFRILSGSIRQNTLCNPK
jgi:hypothetical protein